MALKDSRTCKKRRKAFSPGLDADMLAAAGAR